MPTELDELNRKIMQLEIEEAALKKEDEMCIRDRYDEGTWNHKGKFPSGTFFGKR